MYNMFSRRHAEKLFDCFQIVKAQGKPGYKQSYFSCKTVNCIEWIGIESMKIKDQVSVSKYMSF